MCRTLKFAIIFFITRTRRGTEDWQVSEGCQSVWVRLGEGWGLHLINRTCSDCRRGLLKFIHRHPNPHPTPTGPEGFIANILSPDQPGYPSWPVRALLGVQGGPAQSLVVNHNVIVDCFIGLIDICMMLPWLALFIELMCQCSCHVDQGNLF